MEQNEIIEGNKIIAEFMGYKKMIHKKSREYLLIEIIEGVECARDQRTIERMKYNEYWDWLIPVVEKIGSMDYDWQISKDARNHWTCFFDNKNGYEPVGTKPYTGTLIEIVYKSVIEFIKWYNSQTPRNHE